MIELPPPPPASISIQRAGALWRVRSVDGLFEGVFVDRRSAVRAAIAEADAHQPPRVTPT